MHQGVYYTRKLLIKHLLHLNVLGKNHLISDSLEDLIQVDGVNLNGVFNLISSQPPPCPDNCTVPLTFPRFMYVGKEIDVCSSYVRRDYANPKRFCT